MEKIVAKKKFGQNFLKDETVLQKIVEAMPNNDNKIVEIGPGLGDLTKYLVDVKSVEAFEVDTDLCKLLQNKFEKEIATKQLHINCGDVLNVWKSELIEESYDLVANLPYYIATNIILKALADPKCKNILVMVQLEVAEKFCANEGDKVFGSLSIITQSVGEAHIVVKVPPTAFEPQPKIDSAVFLIQKKSDRCDKDFEDMLRVAFTQPRKTLMKNLSAMYEKNLLQEAFNKLGLTQTVRPHQVSTLDYHQLYKLTRSLDGTRESGN
ncbi:16S rRNA (adenine(1518)-N(6)/adenine(1519)-N(6))-dimethyltransferase RsmA [Sulfurimonas sp. RIFOXYB12_FULL_35_9]|jgi:16S rRNA (adenine1518-N6/adenine1519-N6)-dimethyltransferase|uniref:16S rRNA (adenine(1518)-N(6)/adenine(1519)-N(6))- dimethyltransferase RsmA n=1 Tax=Sulfurimonas sp. RIFOXYB12_FULL_35_9 TaxID=1802256 RepID=UPI0008BB1B12|nr:16S rRNA (adenine(1518)-N(6)/adenine(1519)-N(6))-dimethyltransferase RsmA [Sulfurimonas sp. RIFOXYB12_FULL_35_9]MBS4068763.1 16S rRNA (adenine(1518)-N(6)/adenine(1519)-N(6))-dimethyltransferase RsmA [Sulfurimonas sp.]MDX9757114.1 16S rRNA (adenine(1518)-N(6)/adenine(1519)-N(6))-dimethyltransferase RsmA [Sulfurimonas sp.]OHE03283.1 MAG: 16S rRNA (adenine(1518)-N(6)/adenine(1519)-N(6))-dimethyltransferase [Sulfurimonas sp. RIFOXYB12_FULL_35_9]